MSLIVCKNCGRQISDMADQCPHCNCSTKENNCPYSAQIYSLFVEGLTNVLDFRFNEDTEKGTIIVPQTGLDASIQSATLMINVRDDDAIIMGVYDNFKISTDNMGKVCELLMRINSMYIYPQMILSFDNQFVVCQYRHQFSGDLLNVSVAAKAFMDVGLHLQRCANAIMSVALGLQEPEVAANTIKQD